MVNEPISGKGDGGVTLLPSAEGYESRKKGETTFESIPASQGQTFKTLAPGVTYEIRLAETKNYLPSAIQEITVQPGRKLKVTLPENQKGYTLTASKTQLGWHEDVELTRRLQQALDVVDILLLDHLVIADDDFVSLRDSGYLR